MLVFLLCGCVTTDPKIEIQYVDREVFKVPKFDMPIRPVLKSSGAVDPGTVVRDAENDTIDLSSYASQLEELLKKLQESK